MGKSRIDMEAEINYLKEEGRALESKVEKLEQERDNDRMLCDSAYKDREIVRECNDELQAEVERLRGKWKEAGDRCPQCGTGNPNVERLRAAIREAAARGGTMKRPSYKRESESHYTVGEAKPLADEFLSSHEMANAPERIWIAADKAEDPEDEVFWSIRNRDTDIEYVLASKVAALEQERDRYQRSAEAADWICPGMDGACNRRNGGWQEVCRCGFDRAALTEPEGAALHEGGNDG